MKMKCTFIAIASLLLAALRSQAQLQMQPLTFTNIPSTPGFPNPNHYLVIPYTGADTNLPVTVQFSLDLVNWQTLTTITNGLADGAALALYSHNGRPRIVPPPMGFFRAVQ